PDRVAIRLCRCSGGPRCGAAPGQRGEHVLDHHQCSPTLYALLATGQVDAPAPARRAAIVFDITRRNTPMASHPSAPIASHPAAPRNATFTIGWIMLLVIATLATLNHLLLIFTQQDERLLFLGWAAFNIYATLVLAISFRRRERWAWYTTWVMVIGFAL